MNITNLKNNEIQKTWLTSYIVNQGLAPYEVSNREIFIVANRIKKTLETPEYKTLHIKNYKGQRFKHEDYQLTMSSFLDWTEAFEPNRSYNEKKIEDLINNKITYYDHYDAGIDRKFHPYKWADNLIVLKSLLKKQQHTQKILKVLPSYMALGEQYSKLQNNALYFLYPYSRNIFGEIMEKNWVSGISQGYALAAFSGLCQQLKDKQYCNKAKLILNSYFQIRNTKKGKDAKDLWFSTIDAQQFLWFEEAPLNGDKQFDILNGHIAAIAGLYTYYRYQPDPQVLVLMQAGITTVKRYLNDFREPGHTLRYFRYSANAEDYGPARTIVELKWLSRITNDPYFAKMANIFLADSVIDHNELALDAY